MTEATRSSAVQLRGRGSLLSGASLDMQCHVMRNPCSNVNVQVQVDSPPPVQLSAPPPPVPASEPDDVTAAVQPQQTGQAANTSAEAQQHSLGAQYNDHDIMGHTHMIRLALGVIAHGLCDLSHAAVHAAIMKVRKRMASSDMLHHAGGK